jgi:hypothetical protein
MVLSKRVYNEEIPARDRKELKSPLHFCLGQCLRAILHYYASISPPLPTPLRFMFDRKDGQKESLGTVYYNVRALFDSGAILGNMSFGDRKDEAPLQVADLLVGELRRYHEGKKSEVLDLLIQKKHIMLLFPKQGDFREYVQRVLRKRSNKG